MITASRPVLRIVLATGLAASTGAAQQPYGKGTPGTGGQVPLLSSIRPQVGNASFGLDVRCAPQSTPVFLLIGVAPGSFPLNGVTVLLSPQPFPTYVRGTTSPQGAARFPIPIPIQADLVGLTGFAQAVVVDRGGPQGFAASRGLRFTVGTAPRIFVACSIARNDPFHYFDAATGSSLDRGSPPQVDNTTAAVFDAAGNRLFVASGFRGVGLGDTGTLPIRWSTLYRSSSACYGLHLDSQRQLLWTLTSTSTGRELVAIDVDPSSGTYGNAVHKTTRVVSGFFERWGMAPSGDLAAVLHYRPAALTLVDTDPKSPRFLRRIYTNLPVPVDASGPVATPSRVAITPDERYALVTMQLFGPAEIARLDLATGKWVDHNGAAAGRNIGAASSVSFGSIPTSLEIASDGSFAIVGGIGGCGWVGRLDLDPKNPRKFAWRPFKPTAPLSSSWRAALSPDESEIAVATWAGLACSSPQGPQLVRIAVKTGAQLGTIPIPPNSGGSNQNWYTVVYR